MDNTIFEEKVAALLEKKTKEVETSLAKKD
jgi:hypothetical protein